MPPPDRKKESQEQSVSRFAKKVKEFLDVFKNELAQSDKDFLDRMRVVEEVEGEQGINKFRDQMKRIVLEMVLRLQRDFPAADRSYEKTIKIKAARELLFHLGENIMTSQIYAHYGERYQFGGAAASTTDCVHLLRGSDFFNRLADLPERYFSEGSDLVLHEKLGKVVDIVDRQDFSRLLRYKPTKDKAYVFGLVKPPFFFNGKPNISHIQIPTNLNSDPNKLSVMHASSNYGSVVVEDDLMVYLRNPQHKFERVYVIEIDINRPMTGSQFEREPRFRVPGYSRRSYERPQAYDLPVVVDRFELIDPQQTVDIAKEEKDTLEKIAEDRVLAYMTILTAIREGKLGSWQNVKEETAFRSGLDPEKRSLGLHQITKVVVPLFNNWLAGIDEGKARNISPEIYALWRKKQKGEEIQWWDLTPYLISYDITDGCYKNVVVSTICAYLLIKHLYEDQLMSAYRSYGETFFGLEENPEAIIAVSAAYRSNIDVQVRGSQQYRIAEMACRLGLIDDEFNFTAAARAMPEFYAFCREADEKVDVVRYRGARTPFVRRLYKTKFLIDGYKGFQTSHVAYMCYKKKFPAGSLSIDDFKHAYETSLTNALSAGSSASVGVMKNLYRDLFHEEPRLLMTEDELRGKRTNTRLNTRLITFANEGLWVISHYRKLNEDNWAAISRQTSSDGRFNPIVERALEERSLLTNEISKENSQQARRFMTLIKRLLSSAWYKKYPEIIMAACYTKGLHLEEDKREVDGARLEDGVWIQHVLEFIRTVFENNLAEIERQTGGRFVDEKTRVQIAAASSVMSIADIAEYLKAGRKPDKILYCRDDRQLKRLRIYAKSLEKQRSRFDLKNRFLLEKKRNPTEAEKREKFVLGVFDAVKEKADKRGFGLDFVMTAVSMAALECGWGRARNDEGEPTLYGAANNIFSIKYDDKQYTEDQYLYQNPTAPFYVHHTKEYLDSSDRSRFTEHYEAFKRYEDISGCVEDFFDLVERRYPKTCELGKRESPEPNFRNQRAILSALIEEKYATDPSYVDKALEVEKSVRRILGSYGAIV